MFDFLKLLDVLNDYENNPNFIDHALDLVKDVFHIGKIDIIGKDIFDSKSFIVDKNYVKKPSFSYSYGGYQYIIYQKKDNYKYTDEEIKEINTLLRIMSLRHLNHILLTKAKEAEFISSNTRLPNTHGFLREVSKYCLLLISEVI